ARARPGARPESPCPGRGGCDGARRGRPRPQAAHLPRRRPPHGHRGRVRGPDRFRRPHRSPGPPDAAGARQPRARSRGPAGGGRLPPRSRPAGAPGGGARRAFRGRAHRLLRRPRVHLAPALASGEGRAVTALAEFRHVSFAYPHGAGGRPPFQLRGLSFTLEPGEVLGLIGPNAAGETTRIPLPPPPPPPPTAPPLLH